MKGGFEGRKLFLLGFLLNTFSILHAQILPIPKIDSVSVTFDNRVCIGWSLDNSNEIEKFVIYRKRSSDFAYLPQDTVYATSPWVWYDNNVDFSSEQWYYSLASMNADNNISGLAIPHTYLNMTLGEYETCTQNVHLQRTNYVGWGAVNYEMICEVNSAIVYRAPFFNNTGKIRVIPGVENRVFVRAYSNGKSSTSVSKIIIPENILIDKHVALRSIDNQGQNFKVEVMSNSSRDRKSVLLNYFSNETEMNSYHQEVPLGIQLISFTIPVTNPTGTFSVAVSDICDSIYPNPQRVQAIWLNLIERPNGVFLQWNEPEGYQNLNYTIFLNDGTDQIIEQLSGQLQYYHQLSPMPVSVSSICYRIVATNDTLDLISNRRCISTDDDLLWPNAFIPDGDGFDEVFRPVVKRFYPDTYTLEIFDKKAQRYFVSNNVEHGWNGKYNGALVPLGAYIWRANYTISGKKYQKQGVVNVIY